MWSTHLVAGGLAGVAVDCVLFPLDTLKTRLQARHVVGGGAVAPSGAWLPRAAAFYRGLASAAAGSFPAAATFWVSFEAALDALKRADVGDALAPALAGSAADVVRCTVHTPFEVVKQQLQSGRHGGSTARAVRAIAASGAAGFYAGFGSTVAREIPFAAIQFGLVGALKRRAGAPARQLEWWENGLFGAAAGAVAAALTTPFDVIKTRLMTQVQEEEHGKGSPAHAVGAHAKGVSAEGVPADGARPAARHALYRGWRDAATRIYVEEGAAALFSGWRPRVAWIALGGGVYIGTYEELKRRWGSGGAM